MNKGLRCFGAEKDLTALSQTIDRALFDADLYCISIYEYEPEKWALEVYVDESLGIEPFLSFFENFPNTIPFEANPEDWISKSLEGLPIVRVGKLALYGEHDKQNILPHEVGLQIEAALAFGTGHHGTTRGCLQAYVDLTKKHKFHNVLDVGTGTGVLGIGAAKMHKCKVLGTDIDPEATIVADANAKLNGAAFFKAVTAAGLHHGLVRSHAPYDLIFANILQKPLLKIAPDIVQAMQQKGIVILSGLLHADVRAVKARYGAMGLRMVRHLQDGEWSVVVMKKN